MNKVELDEDALEGLFAMMSHDELEALDQMALPNDADGEYFTSDDDIFDSYAQKSNFLDEDGPVASNSLTNICVAPVVSDMLTACFPSVLSAIFLLACIWLSRNTFPRNSSRCSLMLHAVSIILGLSALFSTTFGGGGFYAFGYVIAYVLFLVVLLSIMAARLSRSIVIMLLAAVILTLDLTTDAAVRHATRGILMIMNMKALSVLLDMPEKIASEAEYVADDGSGAFALTSYFLHPGSLIFGPFISFTAFQQSFIHFSAKRLNVRYFVLVAASFIAMLVTMLTSTCLPMWFSTTRIYMVLHAVIGPTGLAEWLTALFDAISFRFSHYAVCYMSQLILLLSSPVFAMNNDYIVTRPWLIEFPRSLVDVVVNWNIPMHKFLKIYVFQPSRRWLDTNFTNVWHAKFVASVAPIMLTYFVSAFLHGLNFQLWAVLLSLGVLTYAEYGIRRKLAIIFDAPEIKARVQKIFVTRKLFSLRNVAVFLANFAFSLLAYFHLTYLGAGFSQSSTTAMDEDLDQVGLSDNDGELVGFRCAVYCTSGQA